MAIQHGNKSSYVIGVDRGKARTGGPSLEAALQDGYTKARKQKGDGPLTLRVVEIFVSGSNPISDYKIVLKVES